MITRTTDAARLNAVINDPAVRPWFGDGDTLDLAPIVRDPWNICLECDRGGFLCLNWENGWYDVHALFRPHDGQFAVAAMRHALRYLFRETDAQVLVGAVKPGNRTARWLAVIGGFVPWMEVSHGTLFRLDGNRWQAVGGSWAQR